MAKPGRGGNPTHVLIRSRLFRPSLGRAGRQEWPAGGMWGYFTGYAHMALVMFTLDTEDSSACSSACENLTDSTWGDLVDVLIALAVWIEIHGPQMIGPPLVPSWCWQSLYFVSCRTKMASKVSIICYELTLKRCLPSCIYWDVLCVGNIWFIPAKFL